MTDRKTKRFNKDGVEIPDVGPLLDGQSIRIAMSMMDAAHDAFLQTLVTPDSVAVRHSPGYCVAPLTDAQLVNSEAAMAARKKNLSQAWQTPPAKPAVPPLAKKDEAPATDVESLLQARDERLTSAWKTPPAPLPGSSPSIAIDTTRPAVPDVAAALAARDQRLENAWKVPA
jgi:hypothetical protein